jgi:superfamily II DNA or RNA helicase
MVGDKMSMPLFDGPPEPVESHSEIVLRDYQGDAVDGVFEQWEESVSTLVVLPTGTGKSVVFSNVIKRWFERGE